MIAAFRRAFRFDDKATLVIKAGNLSRHPEEASRLRDAARRAGAIILDQTVPRGELNGLIQACDCYVSLHRSEGFGLTMAEAMLLVSPLSPPDIPAILNSWIETELGWQPHDAGRLPVRLPVRHQPHVDHAGHRPLAGVNERRAAAQLPARTPRRFSATRATPLT